MIVARDPRKLRVFHHADALIAQVYRATATFPTHERYVLQAQLRRAVLSTAANIVEGCARTGEGEYVNSLNIANGSCAEARYLVEVAERLGFMRPELAKPLTDGFEVVTKEPQNLIAALRR